MLMTALEHPDTSTGRRVGGHLGLAARGVIYLLVGVIAASLAVRGRGQHADQKGAVTDLASKPFGGVLVTALAVGLAAYSLWQFSQVFTGPVGEEDSKGKRLRSLASALVYAGLAVSAVSVLVGSRKSQASQQSGLTARVMGHSGGRWLVGIVGVAIVIVGIVLMVQGFQASFMKRMQPLPEGTTRTLRRLGQV